MSRSNNRLQLQFALFLCGFYEIKLEKHRLDKKKTIIITDFLRETAISILHLKWNAFFSIGVAFAITVRSKIDEKTRKMGKINRIKAKKAHKNESRGEKSSKTRNDCSSNFTCFIKYNNHLFSVYKYETML